MAGAYLDHASVSPLRPSVLAAMSEWSWAADPGRVHTDGRTARFALEDARAQVAELVGTRPRSVVFTSGGTEAINSAVFGALWGGAAGAVVMAEVEQRSVREASARWASSVVTVPVDGSGRIDDRFVAAAVGQGGVSLVHCQVANQEVGTLQPVSAVVEACRSAGVLVHVDASAAVGQVPFAFDDLGADLASLSAHRMGGPVGIGALLVRRGLRISPLLLGGDQERGRRAGLENVAAAAGFGAAAAEVAASGAEEAKRLRSLSSRLWSGIGSVEGVVRYGPPLPEERLPGLLCVGVAGVEAEPVLVGLDQAGVAAHSGSSCSSEALEPSPVLAAMGVDAEHSLRFSLGWSTTSAEVDLAVAAFGSVVARLRALRA